MIIAHNMMAMNAQRQFNVTSLSKKKSTEKLASGYKINRAADDAAGLTISEKMRSQIRGLNQGIDNTQDGISMVQIGDGALAEVNDMLHRMTELSVKAANETNTAADRSAIQKEISQIKYEIDRISESTEFNTLPLFKGREVEVYEDDGTPVREADIPTKNFSVTKVDLGISPFNQYSSSTALNLQAVISEGAATGAPYNLIYGSGNTSLSSFRLKDNVTNVEKVINFTDLEKINNSYSYDSTSNIWSREFEYKKEGFDFKVKQEIRAINENDDKKYYQLSYTLTNNSQNDISGIFMFNADTSYGGDHNGDMKEEYCVNGSKITTGTTYSKVGGSELTPDNDIYRNAGVNYSGIPDSISIINTKDSLDFSENIAFPDKTDIINLSIGSWGSTSDGMNSWNTYKSSSTLNYYLNSPTTGQDLEFAVMWDLGTISNGDSKTESFNYGLQTTASDSNLVGISLTPSRNIVSMHEGEMPVWIQSGNTRDNGLYIHFKEMNTSVLGLKYTDVSTTESAKEAIAQISQATDYISSMRSELGAYQNRMEHIIENEGNIVENTTAAESRIRDTDMASEMVKFTKENILEQAGISIMSQANQSTQGVLSLLQ